jgi:hypothetical protein
MVLSPDGLAGVILRVRAALTRSGPAPRSDAELDTGTERHATTADAPSI